MEPKDLNKGKNIRTCLQIRYLQTNRMEAAIEEVCGEQVRKGGGKKPHGGVQESVKLQKSKEQGF